MGQIISIQENLRFRPMQDRQPRAVTKARDATLRARFKLMMALPFTILALALMAAVAKAEETITSHGISTFGELALTADFPHLPYVNPNAPKGGEISIWAFGGFDSMNPYSIKGRSERLASAHFESMLTGTADEIGAAYCLLCETLEYPEDRSWVIFNMRRNIAFSDGSPMTSEDVVYSYDTFLTKGLNSFHLVSDGGTNSYRTRIRTPSFPALQQIPLISRGLMIPDLIAIIASIDFVMADVDR